MDRRVDDTSTIRTEIDRVSPDTAIAALALSSATLHEAADKIGVMPPAIKPIAPHLKIAGPAVTVQSPGGDNLWIHRAIYAAKAGDILVVSVSGVFDHGYWGEVMSTAARQRGLAGLVIDGCVRDVALLRDIGFPIFARGLCIRGTGKDFAARGWINAPTLFDDLVVHPGDLIMGDEDGVVTIPKSKAAAAVEAARKREAQEADICRQLEAGKTTLDIYGWQ
jgi:4-hydroxy-4-methyl-2-oxoglutarate aldolase